MDDDQLWPVVGIISMGGKPKYSNKSLFQWRLLTRNPIWTDLRRNLGFHGDSSATNRVIHGNGTCNYMCIAFTLYTITTRTSFR